MNDEFFISRAVTAKCVSAAVQSIVNRSELKGAAKRFKEPEQFVRAVTAAKRRPSKKMLKELGLKKTVCYVFESD